MVSALVNKMFPQHFVFFFSFFISFVCLSFAKLFLLWLKRGKETQIWHVRWKVCREQWTKTMFQRSIWKRASRTSSETEDPLRGKKKKTLGKVVGPNFYVSFSKQTDQIYLVHHEYNKTSCFQSFCPFESDYSLVAELHVSAAAQRRLWFQPTSSRRVSTGY